MASWFDDPRHQSLLDRAASARKSAVTKDAQMAERFRQSGAGAQFAHHPPPPAAPMSEAAKDDRMVGRRLRGE